jgi:PIN domain nuclease of toxin-antitoxin system
MSHWVTDTHSLIWYLEDSPRLGKAANEAFVACDRGEGIIYVPTICLVEIIYLQEKGRIPVHLHTQFEQALYAGTNNFVVIDLTLGIVNALSQVSRTIVPELPDRIIAATALYLSLPLITRDHKIQQLSNVVTIWEIV